MTRPPRVLGVSGPLCEAYDVALLDLDGVVYLGDQPVPGAAAALAEARQRGMRLEYVTNNASRRPAEVTALLARVGVPATEDQVVTSAQAATSLLRERLPAGSRVLVVGTSALQAEVRSAGFEPVVTADPPPAAVVQGYGADTSWRDLAEATVAVRGGALWVATNTDSTLPSPRGALPGNGALVAVVALATGAEPEVVGKPFPKLHQESVQRSGARRPLVVGDRVDTDVAGAVAAGTDSLLVLTGVTTPTMLLSAPEGRRPTYLAADLAGLLTDHPPVLDRGEGTACGSFLARVYAGHLVLDGDVADGDVADGDVPDGDVPDGDVPDGEGNHLDALRALCGAAWRDPLEPSPVEAAGAPAQSALRALGVDWFAGRPPARRSPGQPPDAGTVRGQPRSGRAEADGRGRRAR